MQAPRSIVMFAITYTATVVLRMYYDDIKTSQTSTDSGIPRESPTLIFLCVHPASNFYISGSVI